MDCDIGGPRFKSSPALYQFCCVRQVEVLSFSSLIYDIYTQLVTPLIRLKVIIDVKLLFCSKK